MLSTILIILIILWLLGAVQIPALSIVNTPLLYLGGRAIGLSDILVFALIVWLIGILPSPLRQIASVILVLWLLSFFGILFFGGLGNILVLIIIIGLIMHLFGGWY